MTLQKAGSGLKCYNCGHELIDGRIDENEDAVFDCPECKAENFAILPDDVGPDHFIIMRVRTEHAIKFFLDCENKKCRSLGYGMMPPPTEDGQKPTPEVGPCPDCGTNRAFFTKNF